MTPEELRHRLTYVSPDEGRRKLHDAVRRVMIDAGDQLSGLPENSDKGSREMSLMWTKFEEALMWANAHIARNVHEFKVNRGGVDCITCDDSEDVGAHI
jgi:hypothetical protein